MINEYACDRHKIRSDLTEVDSQVWSTFAGVHLIQDFMNTSDLYLGSKPGMETSRGYSLGLNVKTFLIVSRALGLKNGVSEFFYLDDKIGSEHMDTSLFLNYLFYTRKPIVFFVPPQLRSHSESHLTCEEMDWYLHPDNAAKRCRTHIVFGLYDSVYWDRRY